jgi:hypothetical protein
MDDRRQLWFGSKHPRFNLCYCNNLPAPQMGTAKSASYKKFITRTGRCVEFAIRTHSCSSQLQGFYLFYIIPKNEALLSRFVSLKPLCDRAGCIACKAALLLFCNGPPHQPAFPAR